MQAKGVALGWEHLTDPQVRSGALVPVGGHVLKTGPGVLRRLAALTRTEQSGAAGAATGCWRKGRETGPRAPRTDTHDCGRALQLRRSMPR